MRQYNEIKIIFEKIKTQWIIPYDIQVDMEDILGEDYTIEFRQRCMGCQYCFHSATIDVAVYYEKISLNNQLTRFRKKQSYLDFFSIESEVHQIRTQYLSEPFKIPTGSMIPTLKIGDFILVNKFAYGFKVPFSDITIGSFSSDPVYLFGRKEIKRGDIVVFKYPKSPAVNYIKRVIINGSFS